MLSSLFSIPGVASSVSLSLVAFSSISVAFRTVSSPLVSGVFCSYVSNLYLVVSNSASRMFVSNVFPIASALSASADFR